MVGLTNGHCFCWLVHGIIPIFAALLCERRSVYIFEHSHSRMYTTIPECAALIPECTFGYGMYIWIPSVHSDTECTFGNSHIPTALVWATGIPSYRNGKSRSTGTVNNFTVEQTWLLKLTVRESPAGVIITTHSCDVSTTQLMSLTL